MSLGRNDATLEERVAELENTVVMLTEMVSTMSFALGDIYRPKPIKDGVEAVHRHLANTQAAEEQLVALADRLTEIAKVYGGET